MWQGHISHEVRLYSSYGKVVSLMWRGCIPHIGRSYPSFGEIISLMWRGRILHVARLYPLCGDDISLMRRGHIPHLNRTCPSFSLDMSPLWPGHTGGICPPMWRGESTAKHGKWTKTRTFCMEVPQKSFWYLHAFILEGKRYDESVSD